MGKRAASKAAVKSPSKASRSEAPVSAHDQECSPILGLLELAHGLTDESSAMLKEMAPHCLATPAEDRHAYQKEMVQVLNKVVAGVQQDHLAAVAGVEKEIAEAELGAEAVKVRPGNTEAVVAARKADRDAQETLTKEPADAVAKAKDALAADRALLKSHGSEVSCAQEESDNYSKVLGDMWSSLKAGSPGISWHARNKILKEFMVEFEKLNLGVALNSAVPVALKTKVENRGSFAKSTIDFADSELRKHVTTLTEKVGGAGIEAARRTEAVGKSEAALAAAFAAQEKAFDAFVAAENRFLEAEAQHAAAKAASADLEPAATARQVRLMEAKADLASVQELGVQFAELRDRSRPAPADSATCGEDVPGSDQ